MVRVRAKAPILARLNTGAECMTAVLLAYAAVFLWSLLAATVLPLGSEASLVALVYTQRQVVLPVIVATAGNYLGACTTYWIGSLAGRRVLQRAQLTPWQQRAAALLGRYGQPILLFSWVPVLGDALVLVAGAMQLAFRTFSF